MPEPMSKIAKVQLKKAKSLIEDNRLSEAQQLLTTIDHPTAERWLQELDKHQAKGAKSKPSPKKKRSIITILAYGLGLPVLICGFLASVWYTPEENVERQIRQAINDNVTGTVLRASFADNIVIASYLTDERGLRLIETEIGAIACDLQSADISANEYNITAWEDEDTWIATALLLDDEMQDLDCGPDADRIGRQIEEYVTR